MSERTRTFSELTPDQLAIRAKCFHPSGTFIDFKKEEIEQSIPARFERIVQTYPDRIALKTEFHELSYDTLNRAANRMARAIVEQQGKGEEPVALLLEKDAGMIAGILAVLKAGKIYMPLDPSYPPARLTAMLEDSQASLVVTNNDNLACVREIAGSGQGVINIDEINSSSSSENLCLSISADHLASILYTSGSTGEPKGVVQNHRNILYKARTYTNNLRFCTEDRISLLSPCTFSLSVGFVFGALLNGACLYPMDIREKGLNHLASWLTEEGITVYNAVPTTFRGFIDTLTGEERFPDLRLIHMGGAASMGDVELYKKHFAPHCMMVHDLGSNESGTIAQYFIEKNTPILGDNVPAGYAVDGGEILVLDDSGKTVGPDAVGEIALKSRYVALGYWRKPELTRAAFSSDPGKGEERIYYTGDLGFIRPDGRLQYLGRKDFQVKIRGHRVELAEIEAALLKHPCVREAAVVTCDRHSQQNLVAYWAPRQNPPPTVTDLRRFLNERLPDYMIPSVFLMLKALPLTPNGKLDRSALPEPDEKRPELSTEYTVATQEIEKSLVSIWEELLDIHPIGVHDNFFDLGGHSLTATQLIAAIRDRFAVALPLRSLFESPTVAGLVSEMERRQAVLPAQPSGMFSLPTVVRAPLDRYKPFPLTDIQQAYWVGRFDDFELGNLPTQGYREFECHGLDVKRLEVAWRKLVERHDMLRAVVTPEGRQKVLEQVPPYQIEVMDLREQPSERVEVELAAIREQMWNQAKRIDHWPLFEIRATRLTDRIIRLHLTLDALITDLWSRMILFHEWQQLYEELDVNLPAMELSYRDYVMTMLNFRDSEDYRRSQRYWAERLATLPPAPQLPLTQMPKALDRAKFICWSANLDGESWRNLKRRARQFGLTPSAALLTAYAEVLKVWSKSPRFTINLTHFHRIAVHPKVNDVVGDFTSLILLQVDDVTETDGFKGRAVRLQQQLCDDLDHAHVSGIEVMRQLANRDGGKPRAPMPVVFTSALPHTGEGGSTNYSSKWLGRQVYSLAQTPQVWLDHVVREEDGELILNWNFVDNLFPDSMMRQMFTSYQRLLVSLANETGVWEETWPYTVQTLVPVAQLEERRPKPPRASVPEGLLHTTVLQRAAQQPHRAAIVCRDQIVTYGQLQRAVQLLGFQLRNVGARPNKLVAVVMEKGWEQVVAVIGTLAAGAAYLPLDPHLPTDRLSHILRHAQVELVVTQPHLENTIEWPEDVRCFSINETLFAEGIVPALESIQNPTDLAYVIYTSGSTGEPKGVMIDHRGALNTIMAINERFGVGFEDRVLAVSSLSFDLSVYDIFGALLAGGTIVLPDSDGQRDPSHWAELIVRHNVSVWNSVPALMKLLIEYIARRPEIALRSLRLVLLSGDWIPVTLPDQIRARTSNAQVVSLGGATEASIWSILYPIEQVNPDWKSIPYGRALPNQQVYVLNQGLELCPAWVPGQLYIAGAGLAKGYWCDDQRTHQSFLVHPRTGQRLYRTGDIGCYLPDGNIQFLGREDNQVKIQGYRIELGEIEAVINEHPQLQASVVIAHARAQSERRLIAYVVPKQGQTVDTGDLQALLLRKLPDYMVPASIVILETLPLTSNGKIDRSALTPPSAEADDLCSRNGGTQDDWIPLIKKLVESVMEIEIGFPDKNLISHGATSMDIIRIVNRIEEEFGFRLKVDQVYQEPTLEGLVRRIRQHIPPQAARCDVTSPSATTVSGIVLRDPAEREAFKNAQRGLRRQQQGQRAYAFPDIEFDEAEARAHRQRRTRRDFLLEPIPMARFGAFLSSLRQRMIGGQPKYRYGSAGGLYPVQTYCYVKTGRVEGLPAGLYYYHPVEHQLVAVTPVASLAAEAYDLLINRPVFESAAFAIFLVARMSAILSMYGERSLHFATLEAGLMTQLLETVAPSYGLGLCQVGDMDFERIRHLFLLEQSDLLVHSILGGAIAETELVHEQENGGVSCDMQLLEHVRQLSNEEVRTLLEAHRKGNG